MKPQPGRSWQTDRVATEPCPVDVAGVVLMNRFPSDHPLHALPCGLLIVRLAGSGRASGVWYN